MSYLADISDQYALCDWCAPPKLAVHRNGLCRRHWLDAHDGFDQDGGE